jgi:hypothetical protein
VQAILDGLPKLWEWVKERIIALLGPGIAALLDGPLGDLLEKAKSSVQEWVQGLLSDSDIGSAIENLKNNMRTIASIVQAVVNGNPSSCPELAAILSALSNLVESFMNNPAIEDLQRSLEASYQGLNQLGVLVFSPLFDTVVNLVGGVTELLGDFAGKLADWGGAIKEFLGGVWSWIAGQLGLPGDDEGGLFAWLKERVAEAWQSVTEFLAPVAGPLRNILEALTIPASVRQLREIIGLVPQLVEAIRWLWANRGNPDIVQDAHEQMGHTILPQLLEGGQIFSETLVGLATGLVNWIEKLATSALELLGAITGIPLLNAAQGAVQIISNGVQTAVELGRGIFLEAVKGLQNLITTLKSAIEPFIEVLCSIGMALLNPGMIPNILLGWAWRKIPDCYKPPIINFLLDIVITCLAGMPDLPALGMLWPLVKSGVLGFLEGFRSADDETKVMVTNRLAKIISGASPAFIFGFVKGLLRGIWEGVTDPFLMIYYAIVGLNNLYTWLENVSDQAYNRAFGLETESTTPSPSAPTATGDSASAEPATDPTALLELAGETQALAGGIRPPIDEVRGGFMNGVEEFFSGGGDTTLKALAARFESLWGEMEAAIRGAAGDLAARMMDFFTQDAAEGQLGDTVGWLAGTIVFEVVLNILTAGSVAAAKGIMKPLTAFAKFLDWTGEAMGLAFRALAEIAEKLLDLARGLGKLIPSRIVDALNRIGDWIWGKIDNLLKLSEHPGVLSRGLAGEATEEAVEEVAEEWSERCARLLGQYDESLRPEVERFLSEYGEDAAKLLEGSHGLTYLQQYEALVALHGADGLTMRHLFDDPTIFRGQLTPEEIKFLCELSERLDRPIIVTGGRSENILGLLNREQAVDLLERLRSTSLDEEDSYEFVLQQLGVPGWRAKVWSRSNKEFDFFLRGRDMPLGARWKTWWEYGRPERVPPWRFEFDNWRIFADYTDADPGGLVFENGVFKGRNQLAPWQLHGITGETVDVEAALAEFMDEKAAEQIAREQGENALVVLAQQAAKQGSEEGVKDIFEEEAQPDNGGDKQREDKEEEEAIVELAESN